MNNEPKIGKVFKINIVLGIILVALAIAYYFVFFLPSKNLSNNQATEVKPLDDLAFKKQLLDKFANDIKVIIANKDWGSFYELQPQIIREAIAKDDYIEYLKINLESKYYSENTEITDIKIDGDKGTVYRQITYCTTQECEGNSKNIVDGTSEYEYINGKWQIPDPNPSERAIQAATSAYIEFISGNKKEKSDFHDKYSFGKESVGLAIRKYALWLDDNLEQLVYVEKVLEKKKGSQNSSGSYSSVTTPMQIPVSENSQNPASVMDKVNQESKEKCQQDIATYNMCMNDYNTKLSEYNTCLNTRAYDNALHGGAFCYKPMNLCSKPICAR